MEDNQFSREELQELRARAIKCADEVKAELWISAYTRLAEILDCLDAMEARTKDTDN